MGLAGPASRWPRPGGVRKADYRRLPAGLDGHLLAGIGNAPWGLPQHRTLDRRPDAHSSLGRSLAS